MTEALLHTPEILFTIDSTVDEESSYNLVSLYKPSFPLNYYYDSKQYTLEQALHLCTQFAIFSGRVKLSPKEDSQTIGSKVPLEVFRYKMLDDGSWYYAKTTPRNHKPGYIVEGALWTNGMFYIVRTEDTKEVLEATLSVDQYTKDLHGYP
jgi:hypothetical protein